jgi:hypothetical protein
MDPAKETLLASPRDLGVDAFFAADRSTNGVTRTVGLQDLQTNAKTTVSIPGFASRHVLGLLSVTNPLPHSRLVKEKGNYDESLRGWTHEVRYRHLLSQSASALGPATRLRVTILFGTGTEANRHGIASVIAAAPQPTLLIIVRGIEPGNEINFTSPDGKQHVKVRANTRWGVGITTASIESIITTRFGHLVPYDIVIAAAFSTGYLGLGGSINAKLFSLASLERIVVYDCLYRSLMQPLAAAKALRGKKLEIIAYVVTGGGNDFKSKPETYASLALGGNQTWNYINLFFNTNYRAITSARVVDEGRSAGNPIITALPLAYEKSLNTLVNWLPPRTTVVSDWNVFTKIKGTAPTNAVTLTSLAANGKRLIADFFKGQAVAVQCFQHGWLLGWPTTPGEDWHDLLLVEFGWEYLT